jgi:hypothetical protein
VTAKQLIDEMQKLIAQHPEAAELPVCFVDESYDNLFMEEPITRVQLLQNPRCFLLDAAH